MAGKVKFSSIESNDLNKASFDSFSTSNNSIKKEKTHFEEIDKNELKLDPKEQFQALYPLNLDVVNELVERFDNIGFDKSQCIHIASFSDEPETGEIVIDGHHRLAAAIQSINVDKIPVYRHKFQTRQDAVIYALELQLKRRNLDKKELFLNYEKLKKLQSLLNGELSEEETVPGKKAEQDAKKLGISTRQVEKMNAIESSENEELKEDVRSGKLSVNAAYDKLKGNSPKKKHVEDEEISDSLEDKSGEPKGITITDHSDGIERPSNKLTPEQDANETALRKESYELGVADGEKKGFAKGIETGVIYVLSEILKGKSPEEIYNCEELKDYTPSEICNFKLPDDAEDLVLKLQK